MASRSGISVKEIRNDDQNCGHPDIDGAKSEELCGRTYAEESESDNLCHRENDQHKEETANDRGGDSSANTHYTIEDGPSQKSVNLSDLTEGQYVVGMTGCSECLRI